jgi:hypothetical protein
VLGLAVGKLDLQDDVACRDGERGERVGERLFELEAPPLCAFAQEVGKAREPRAACLRLLEPR